MDAYELKGYYRIKFAKKEYPWPSKHDPTRTIVITKADVLTLTEDSTVIKHGPHGCFGIEIPMEDLEFVNKPICLESA